MSWFRLTLHRQIRLTLHRQIRFTLHRRTRLTLHRRIELTLSGRAHGMTRIIQADSSSQTVQPLVLDSGALALTAGGRNPRNTITGLKRSSASIATTTLQRTWRLGSHRFPGVTRASFIDRAAKSSTATAANAQARTAPCDTTQ